jgi:hypothetical protein
MPQALADNYLGAINGAIANLNMASDMKSQVLRNTLLLFSIPSLRVI